jgi:hypothetical protein
VPAGPWAKIAEGKGAAALAATCADGGLEACAMVCCAMAAQQDKVNVIAKAHWLFNDVIGCLNKCMIVFKN